MANLNFDRGDWDRPTATTTSPDNRYLIGNIVQHQGSNWRCITNETTEEPSPGATDWVHYGFETATSSGGGVTNIGVDNSVTTTVSAVDNARTFPIFSDTAQELYFAANPNTSADDFNARALTLWNGLTGRTDSTVPNGDQTPNVGIVDDLAITIGGQTFTYPDDAEITNVAFISGSQVAFIITRPVDSPQNFNDVPQLNGNGIYLHGVAEADVPLTGPVHLISRSSNFNIIQNNTDETIEFSVSGETLPTSSGRIFSVANITAQGNLTGLVDGDLIYRRDTEHFLQVSVSGEGVTSLSPATFNVVTLNSDPNISTDVEAGTWVISGSEMYYATTTLAGNTINSTKPATWVRVDRNNNPGERFHSVADSTERLALNNTQVAVGDIIFQRDRELFHQVTSTTNTGSLSTPLPFTRDLVLSATAQVVNAGDIVRGFTAAPNNVYLATSTDLSVVQGDTVDTNWILLNGGGTVDNVSDFPAYPTTLPSGGFTLRPGDIYRSSTDTTDLFIFDVITAVGSDVPNTVVTTEANRLEYVPTTSSTYWTSLTANSIRDWPTTLTSSDPTFVVGPGLLWQLSDSSIWLRISSTVVVVTPTNFAAQTPSDSSTTLWRRIDNTASAPVGSGDHPLWNSSTAYNPGNIVIDDNRLFRNIVAVPMATAATQHITSSMVRYISNPIDNADNFLRFTFTTDQTVQMGTYRYRFLDNDGNVLTGTFEHDNIEDDSGNAIGVNMSSNRWLINYTNITQTGMNRLPTQFTEFTNPDADIQNGTAANTHPSVTPANWVELASVDDTRILNHSQLAAYIPGQIVTDPITTSLFRCIEEVDEATGAGTNFTNIRDARIVDDQGTISLAIRFNGDVSPRNPDDADDDMYPWTLHANIHSDGSEVTAMFNSGDVVDDTTGSQVLMTAADEWLIRVDDDLVTTGNFPRMVSNVSSVDFLDVSHASLHSGSFNPRPGADLTHWERIGSDLPNAPSRDGTYQLTRTSFAAGENRANVDVFAGGGTAATDSTGITRLGGGTQRVTVRSSGTFFFSNPNEVYLSREPATTASNLSLRSNVTTTELGAIQSIVFREADTNAAALRTDTASSGNSLHLLVYRDANNWAAFTMGSGTLTNHQGGNSSTRQIANISTFGMGDLAGEADVIWADNSVIDLILAGGDLRAFYDWEEVTTPTGGGNTSIAQFEGSFTTAEDLSNGTNSISLQQDTTNTTGLTNPNADGFNALTYPEGTYRIYAWCHPAWADMGSSTGSAARALYEVQLSGNAPGTTDDFTLDGSQGYARQAVAGDGNPGGSSTLNRIVRLSANTLLGLNVVVDYQGATTGLQIPEGFDVGMIVERLA